MPSLILLKSPEGAAPDKLITLTGDPQIIGRDADRCQIVIPYHAVSREHAKISAQNGAFFIEDLKSRNHTYVNSKEVGRELPERTQLKCNDRIKICDFLYQFRDDQLKPQPAPVDMTRSEELLDCDEAIQVEVNAQDCLEVAPSDRLRSLLEISNLARFVVDVDFLLPQVVKRLFGIFMQAERCFVIFVEEGKLIPKAVQARPKAGEDIRFSKTIVRKTIDSMESHLYEGETYSGMCVPLFSSDGHVFGAIQLDTRDVTRKFLADDLNLLTIFGNLTSVAIEKTRSRNGLGT